MSITARLDAITSIGPEYRATFLPAPKSCKLELSAACNFKCSYCVRSLRDQTGEMDREFYSRLIKQLASAGVSEVGLFYIGESFLCKWLPAAIREAKEAGIEYVFLTTNGSAAVPEKVEACMRAGLDSLKFSLNYSDERQMEIIAGVAPSMFRRVLSNVKAARRVRDEGGYACGLYASSIMYRDEQGERMQRVVDEVRPFLDEAYFLPLFSMDGANQTKRVQGNPGRLGAMRDPLPCFAVTTGHVTYDGMLSACCFGRGADDCFVMADLNEVDFMTGWNSDKFQKLRAAHLAKNVVGTPCEACIAG